MGAAVVQSGGVLVSPGRSFANGAEKNACSPRLWGRRKRDDIAAVTDVRDGIAIESEPARDGHGGCVLDGVASIGMERGCGARTMGGAAAPMDSVPRGVCASNLPDRYGSRPVSALSSSAAYLAPRSRRRLHGLACNACQTTAPRRHHPCENRDVCAPVPTRGRLHISVIGASHDRRRGDLSIRSAPAGMDGGKTTSTRCGG
jgi:hypothetical protein